MDIITVKELMEACKREIKKGNGDKKILLSDDDEGNGYHSLYYLFSSELKEEDFEWCTMPDGVEGHYDEYVTLG